MRKVRFGLKLMAALCAAGLAWFYGRDGQVAFASVWALLAVVSAGDAVVLALEERRDRAAVLRTTVVASGVVVDGAPVAPPADEPTCPTCGLVFASPYFLAAHVCEVRMRRDVRLGAFAIVVAIVLSALLIVAVLEA